MKSTALIIFSLLALSAFANNLPGIQATIETDLINAYKDELVPELDKKIEGTRLPDISTWWYSVTDVIIQRFVLSENQANVELGNNTIDFVATGWDLEITFNFKFLFIKQEIDVTSQDCSLSVQITPGFADGELTFTASDSTVDIKHLKVTDEGFLGKIFQWIANWIFDSTAFLDNLDKTLAAEVVTGVQASLDEFVDNFNYQQEISGTDLSISLQPVAALEINTEYISAPLDGEVYVTSKGRGNSTIESNVTLPVTQNDENLQVFVSNYVIKTGLDALYSNGDLNVTITPDDVPSQSPFKLNTGSLGLLFPGLITFYGNAQPCELVCWFDPENPPFIDFENDVSLDFDYVCNLWALNATTNEYQLAVNFKGEISFQFDVSAIEDDVEIKITTLRFVTITIIQSNIGTINAPSVVFKLNLTASGFITALNFLLSEADIPIPQIPGYTLSNVTFTLDDGFMSFVGEASPSSSEFILN
mmetsp:Transcript_1893/g.1779  ORF Transcript_1893/g.1779 Transcript_1893/m.1779 type:complete len:476 (+) Transcript_1893:133-1560(+)